MSQRSNPATDLALVAVFAGLIAAFALTPAIPVGPLGVPITLQTLAVALTGLVLGPWRGFLATTLYLVVGFAGLPVFAQGASGLGVFAKMSIGYLLAFPLAALLVGLLAERVLRRNRRPRWFWLFAAALTGSILVVHPLGILGMSINGQLAPQQALMADMLYWPGDLIKSAVAAVIAVAVHKAFPTLLARPAAEVDAAREVVVTP